MYIFGDNYGISTAGEATLSYEILSVHRKQCKIQLKMNSNDNKDFLQGKISLQGKPRYVTW